VVGALSSGGKLDPGDVAVQASWRVRIGADARPPAIATIAPGLAVYRVAATDSETATLEDDKHRALITVKVVHTADKLAAPRVKRVYHSVSHGRHGSTDVIAVLDGSAPEGALALVLADEKGVARSWGQGSGSAWTVLSSGGCRTIPNGTVLSGAGDKVTLFWLGADGRVSPATKPLVVEPK